MTGVVKRFGPTVALGGVDLDVHAGEVHALIGENGAGKSTLMKVLSGAHRPDDGSITLAGEPYAPSGPLDGRAAGVGMIYQELNLAPDLSVEANVFLGAEVHRSGLVKRSEHEAEVRKALAFLGHEKIDPRTLVSDLSVGEQQVVEIARALTCDARIIVLDEPTSSLTRKDTERLFDVIARLKSSGVGVIYISHFLDEVFRVADRYTVLRNGETVGTGSIADVDTDTIISLMVGRSLEELFPIVPHEHGEPILELDSLCGESLPNGVSLTLHRGEILGIAGLIGAGRTETLRAIYGLDPVKSGEVTVLDAQLSVSARRARPDLRLRQGVGLLSEDRKGEGLALSSTIAENVTLSDLRSVSKRGVVSLGRERSVVSRWIERVKIKCLGPSQSVSDLSGGNQQKVAIARLLHQSADVLLLDEPTRGIDVGSKVEVYRLMGELAAEGKAVLFVSSYIPELLGVTDRIAVMSRGKVQAVRDTRDWTEQDILREATSGEQAA